MNFTQVMRSVFNNLHTLLLLLGFVCVNVAITLIISPAYGLLALGVTLIVLALILNKEQEGG